MYEFLMIFDWLSDTIGMAAVAIETYRTKDELLAAYEEAKEVFKDQIEENRLIISAAVNYSWTDIEQLF